MTPYGKRLREIRLKADWSMGQLARELGFTVPYISDIEHGRRQPLSDDLTVRVANLLGADSKELLRLAGISRRSVSFDTGSASDKAREAISALHRQFPTMAESDWDVLLEALKGKHK